MIELMTREEIAAVREQPERSSGLPARCYTDPAFYELEKERVFRRSWLGVGRAEQVSNPGDYFHHRPLRRTGDYRARQGRHH
ncbi:MAG TPA: hypothetical protein EYQ54_21760 [Myxococcales bacterium]|nr:hypothetical protein [Myxococcales bacterium]